MSISSNCTGPGIALAPVRQRPGDRRTAASSIHGTAIGDRVRAGCGPSNLALEFDARDSNARPCGTRCFKGPALFLVDHPVGENYGNVVGIPIGRLAHNGGHAASWFENERADAFRL